jgi:undecaprenyl-diphosphatase
MTQANTGRHSHDHEASLPVAGPSARRHGLRVGLVILVWAVLIGVLSVIGELVVHSSTVNTFDRQVTSTVIAHRSPVLDALMKGITWLGSWVALAAAAGLLVFLWAKRLLVWTAVVLAVLAWAGETTGVTLTKLLVQRNRPPQALWLVQAHGSSWPSGHAATAMLVFTILSLTVIGVTENMVIRAVTCGAAVLAVIGVCYSRLELGVHWSTDVMASIVYVAAWLGAWTLLRGVMTPRQLPRGLVES